MKKDANRYFEFLDSKIQGLIKTEEKMVKNVEQLEIDLIWATTKLAQIRANFGNAPFTTNDMDRIIRIIGTEAFNKASIPNSGRHGVWGD